MPKITVPQDILLLHLLNVLHIGGDEPWRKSLDLLSGYAQRGGVRGVDGFLKRLEGDRLTQRDRLHIRENFFPKESRPNRREMLLSLVTYGAAATLGGALAADLYSIHKARKPNLPPKQKKRLENIGAAAVKTGRIAAETGGLSLAFSKLLHTSRMAKFERTDEFEDMVAQLESMLMPAVMRAVTQGMQQEVHVL